MPYFSDGRKERLGEVRRAHHSVYRLRKAGNRAVILFAVRISRYLIVPRT
jgi:hypothetical protein